MNNKTAKKSRKRRKPYLPNQLLVKDYRKLSNSCKSRSIIVFSLFLISFYCSLATIFNFSLPSELVYIYYPYNFLLFNLFLHTIALMLSLQVLYIGFSNIFRPNCYTLVAFSSMVTLFQVIHTIVSSQSIGYLPFTPIAILILFYSNESLSDYNFFTANAYKVSLSTENIKFVTQNNPARNGIACKNETNDEDFFKNLNITKNSHKKAFFYGGILIYIIVLSVSLYASDFAKFLWSLSALSIVTVPINFLSGNSFPLKMLSMKLTKHNSAFRSYSDIKRLSKNKNLSLSDRDIFDVNSIFLETIETFYNYTEAEIITFLASIYRHLNLSASQAFEREFLSRNLRIKQVSNVEMHGNNGFSFFVTGGEIYVGNANLLSSMDIIPISSNRVKNPIYIVSYGKIIGIVSLTYKASPRISKLLKRIHRQSLKVVISTDDFCVNPSFLNELFNVRDKTLIYYQSVSSELNNIKNEDNLIYISKYSGISYILTVLYCKKAVGIIRFNNFMGLLACYLSLAIVSYLIYNFSPHLLVPHNLLLVLIVWYVPSFVASMTATDI